MHDSIPLDRRRRIGERLRRGISVSASALAQEFVVSEDAIRRDLRALAAEGQCKRVYGGALPLSPEGVDFEHRVLNHPCEKRALALAALPLLEDNAVIFLDSGTTNLALAREIPNDRNLTIATNSIPIAAALFERKHSKLIVFGGQIDSHIAGSVGAAAVREAEQSNFDLCFLGACAVSAKSGIGTFHLADADFKRAVISSSGRIAALVTMDKLETRAPYRIGKLAVLDHLVLDHNTSADIITLLSDAGPGIVLTKP